MAVNQLPNFLQHFAVTREVGRFRHPVFWLFGVQLPKRSHLLKQRFTFLLEHHQPFPITAFDFGLMTNAIHLENHQHQHNHNQNLESANHV